MRKFLFLVFAVLIFLGCSNNDDMPCITCNEQYAYCFYNGSCNSMSTYECDRYGGRVYSNYQDCNNRTQLYSSGSSYAYCLYDDDCSYMSVYDCNRYGGWVYDSYSDCSDDLSPYAYCLYGGSCMYMSVYDCNRYYGGWVYSDSWTCNSSIMPSSSSAGEPASSRGNDIANYSTVEIGDLVWMAENLDYNVSGSQCYDNNSANCATYGRIYNWATAMALPSSCNYSNCDWQIDTQHRGICPSGWHIPSFDEWYMLLNYGGFGNADYYNNWWSSNEMDDYLYAYTMYYSYYSYYEDYSRKSNLFSVRCVQDYSSSTKPSSSSNSKITCSNLPSTATAGIAITPPTVICGGTIVPDGVLSWINAPNWSYPTSGTYYDISAIVIYGDCNGKTAYCGTMTVVSLPSSSSRAASSSSSYVVPSSSSLVVPSSSSTQVVAVSCSMNYKTTAVIGTQTWMAENLNCDVSGSKCYDNDPANCAKYGRLYDWATAMALPSSCNSNSCSSQIGTKHRGICPDGWHIPSDAEWTTLTDYVGGSSTAGKYLKATDGWTSCGPSGSGKSYLCEDTYGFSALPGGYGSSGGYFNYAGDIGYWWSASEYSSSVYHMYMRYYNEFALYDVCGRDHLLSVRCVQDSP